MPIIWPKNPKIDDVVVAVNSLEARVATIEATANSNRARLDDLDHFKTDHSAGAVKRQQEVDQLRAENRRVRWALTRKR